MLWYNIHKDRHDTALRQALVPSSRGPRTKLVLSSANDRRTAYSLLDFRLPVDLRCGSRIYALNKVEISSRPRECARITKQVFASLVSFVDSLAIASEFLWSGDKATDPE